MTPFGREIRKMRSERGVTLSDMAKALQVSPAYLSALEHGKRGKPSIPMVNVVGTKPSNAPMSPVIPDGSITRPFNEVEAETLVSPGTTPPAVPAAAAATPAQAEEPAAIDGLGSTTCERDL